MKSSSLKMIDAGIDKPREYRDALIHDWYFPESFQKHLSMYILAETIPERLFFHMKDGELAIKGKLYSVIWIDPPEKVREAKFALLSVRFCPFLNRGYVLVKVLKGDTQYKELEF